MGAEAWADFIRDAVLMTTQAAERQALEMGATHLRYDGLKVEGDRIVVEWTVGVPRG